MSGPRDRTSSTIRGLLSGHAPNGVTPSECGIHAGLITALYAAHQQGGTEAVRRSFEAYVNEDPALAKLIAGDPDPLDAIPTFTAQELGAMEIPEPQFVVDGVVPEGCSVLAAAPKIGKSLLAQGISYAIASGGRALGSVPVKKKRVLYLALEGSKRGLKRRLLAMSNGEALPTLLHFVQDWPSQDEGGYDLLAQWIERYSDTGLVVIDTLKRIRSRKAGNKLLYDLDYDALNPLTTISERTSVPIIVIHHTRKMDSSDPLDLVSGSYGLTAAVDNILIMQRGRGKVEAKLTVVAREEEEQELALKFDESIATWMLMGEANEVAMSEARKRVREVLIAEGRPMKPAEIAALLGESTNNIRQLCWKMKQKGKLTQPEDGKYELHPLNNGNSDNGDNG